LCTDQSGVNSYKYRFDYSANNYVEQFSDKKEGAGLRLFRPASVLEQTFPDGTYCDDYIGNDGQFYQTVKIGTQVWLAQNLAETKYRDGSTISTVTDNTAWSNLTTSAKCSYNNDENNVYLFATARQDIFSPNFTTSMSFVSPSGSTTSTLTTEMGVNIVQKTALLYDYSNIQYIYTVTNTNTTHAAQSGADSYIWGDSNNTYPQVSLTNSIPFLSGSTNRWVAYTKSTFNGSVIIPLGATWVYVGKNTTSISSAISNTTLKYIIKDTKSNFTTLGSFSFMGSNLTGLLSLPYNLTSIGDSAFNGCSNLVGSLNIPSSVTTIGNSTFANCYGFIGTLTLPNSLTSIGSSAFSNCHSFTGNLTIPNSVSTLGNSAFENCYGFNGTLTLPSGITYIGAYVFNSCSSFTGSVTIPSSVTSIGYASFNSCYGFNGTLTIPSSVTTISDYAFSNSYGFTGNLTIPSGVTYIGNYSFNNCYGFTGSLTIPSGTTTLNNNTFNMCYGLNGILYLHSGITSIGITTFNGCTNLTGVYSYNLTAPTLGFHAFTGVPKTNTLTIYGSSTGYQAGGWEEFTPQNYFPHPNFQSAISFVSPSGSTTTSIATEMGVNITNIINSVGVSTAQYIYSVTTTGTAHTATPGADSYTFGSSLDATTTQVSNNITFTAGSTGRFVIFNHSNMVGANAKVILPVGCRWVYLGKNVTNSGNNQVVTGIKYIHYAGSSFKVDDYGFMFKSETTLTGNVTFPNYITQIGSITGYGLFDGCTNISGTITIPNSVVTMYGYEFRNCINITGLVLSSSLTSIGPNSFEGCTGLNTSITIPNGVTSIGSECFKNSWVTGLVLPNSYTNIGPNYPLIYMIKLNNITLGNAVTNIGYLGIYGCPLLPSITLPSTISTLGQYALSDCTTLMEIICNAVTPPSIASSNTLSGIPATCSIKVPASSVAAYQAAAFWSSRAAYITGI
jgi:uncharacterized protein (TIGR02145 family)